MNNEEIVKVAQKHKKMLEKIDVFPYEFKTDATTYQMAHFYRLTSKLYGSYIYTPYDLSYGEVKSVFYKFILLEEYLKNKIAKLNEYASQDLTKSYYHYRDLIKELEKERHFSAAKEEMNKIIEAINYIENALKEVSEKYKEFQNICQRIKNENSFDNEQLERIRTIHGESQALLFLQTLKQKDLVDLAKNIYNFMKENDLGQNPSFKEVYEKTNILVNDKSVLTLENSLRKFGKLEEIKDLSYEELVQKQIQLYEKDFFIALNEDFIKRRVRNPSVQES
ncbi:hypothetical protein JOC86_004866 [Bacillus pakistanensis]|uniref:Uncharacterized protein n=1 Tax=Rossellomorea pakistanensis TaxID=992288 RepID=A0ABS2NKA2_9BACI|nr:hypothetical protein [Bacillus pakistanensis]MBM7588269.1 hypothetical protein [Bacillus pakistanensis]